MNMANYIEDLTGQVLARWRDEVRRDPERVAPIHHVGDRELEDHLSALIDKVIKLFRGETTDNLADIVARHGRQRRALGFSVVQLLREFQILRRVLIGTAQEIVGLDASTEEIERGRNLIIDTIDRSMNASV